MPFFYSRTTKLGLISLLNPYVCENISSNIIIMRQLFDNLAI